MRVVALDLFIGSNGVGKSYQLKKLLKVNNRNLILPANRFDTAWMGIKEIKPVWKFKLDPRDPKQKRKIPYVSLPGLNSFKGKAVVFIDEPEIFRAVTDPKTGFRSGGLFLDDFKNYIPSAGLLPGHVRRLFGDRRHKELDIFLASHSFQDINAEILQFRPSLFVFEVTRPPNKNVLEKIENSDQLMRVYNNVRKVNDSLPQGKHYYFERFMPA